MSDRTRRADASVAAGDAGGEHRVPLREDAASMGIVGLAHGISHFSQLLIPPLFPWLKDAFAVSYSELGLLMTVFFVISAVGQTAAGFVVDRKGAIPVLLTGIAILGVSALVLAASQSYWMLLLGAALGGLGNSVFHPADYTLLNRKVSTPRLGHAYAVHGISGSVGWGTAPLLLVSLTLAFNWRVALVGAALVIFAVALFVWTKRGRFAQASAPSVARHAVVAQGFWRQFDFLSIPSVWLCFGFFFTSAVTVSGVQTFAPEASRLLHDMSLTLTGLCLTIFMIGNATGMGVGGFLVSRPERCERIIGVAYVCSAAIALTLGLANLPGFMVPVLFGVLGIFSGIAAPSRDVLVKRSTPSSASGRVFGVVYSGLDSGLAIAPLFFGLAMDLNQPAMVWIGIAGFQMLLVMTAFNFRHVRGVRPAVASS